MKRSRRSFLKTGVAGAAAAMVPTTALLANEAPSTAGKRQLVLSTWRHGIVANDEAVKVMAAGGSVLDAVEKGVMVVESDFTNRSVGLGGRPDRDGFVTLDACIQDHDGSAGGVAFLREIEHPISVARQVMEKTPHVLLVGEGAQQFALANGFEKKKVEIEEVKKAWREWLEKEQYKPKVNIENHDTIGMIAMDKEGRLAGSCTTSGLAYKMHGRVGDSPIIGAGLFVDGDVGAACATGVGELVIKTAGSHTVVELMRHGRTAEEACKEAVLRIMKKNPDLKDMQVGFLAIRADGTYGGHAIYNGFEMAVSDATGTSLEQSAFEQQY